MQKYDPEMLRFMIQVIALQSFGFQTDLVPDVGGLFRVTVYRHFRDEREAIRMTVFTALADLPAAYVMLADELSKVTERFLTREDLIRATAWVTDAEMRSISRINDPVHWKEIAADIAMRDLERSR